jgi:hypothetical protein
MITLDEKSLRKEIKFKIFELDRSTFISWLLGTSNFRQSYPDRTICSLYYDTIEYDFAYNNMTGVSDRTKLRVRWYPSGSNNEDKQPKNSLITCFLERKRKSNDLSDKVTLGEKTFENYNSMLNQLMILRSWVNQISSIHTEPNISYVKETALITYNRRYFEHIIFPNLRLTVDNDIFFKDINTFTKSTHISKNYFVVELKYSHNDEKFIHEIMKTFPFRRTRYSKYLNAMSNLKNVSY